MKTAIRSTALLLVIAIMVATFLGASAQTQEGMDPAAVVAAIYDAVGEKDIDSAVALLADDAVLTLIPPPAGLDGTFIGKEEIGGWYDVLAADNGQAEFSNIAVSGNTATMNMSWTSDMFESLGVGPAEFDGTAVVQDGLLKSLAWVFTPEFNARLASVLAREANRAAVTRYMEELWNEGDLDVADEVLAEDFTSHNYPAGDSEDLKESVVGFHAENPNAYFAIDDLVLTEDQAFVQVTIMERPEGAAATAKGKPAGPPMLLVLGVEDGKISERWLFLWAESAP